MKKTLFILLALTVMSGCAEQFNTNPKHHADVVNLESVIHVSSEKVTISLNSIDFKEELIEWLNKDQPTKATLACHTKAHHCVEAEKILHSFGVPFHFSSDRDENTATLLYEKVVAKECVNNKTHAQNLPIGCAVTSNMMRMITDHNQLVKPKSAHHHHNAARAAHHYNEYHK